MRKSAIDTVIRVRLAHQPGQLSRVLNAIAAQEGSLGEITTIHVGERATVRDLTIESDDEGHRDRIINAVQALDHIELLKITDQVFDHHRGGKIRMTSRVELKGLADLRAIYTPGVARVARAIERDPERAWELTSISESVGIFTNGTRVLGLGDIGPLASLPVMEGKAVLYDKFAGLSAIPMLVDTKDPDEFVNTVVRLSKSFGAIHLEDIRTPDCFYIEQQLIERLRKPVMHDDQHGTATAALAGVINACKITGKDLKKSRVGQVGLGAAGSAIALLARAYGAGEVLVTDVSEDAKKRMAGRGCRPANLATLMSECDIVIATTGKPGLIQPSMIRKGQVIFALSNPDPEISPGEALAAGAAFAGDGRSINNALAFPGLFKGALQVRSRAITPEMLVAAAEAIAHAAEPGTVVPNPLNPEVHEAVRAATIEKAREQGLAGTARA